MSIMITFPLTLAQIEADPVPVIEHWMSQYPCLWWGGIAGIYERDRWPDGRLEEYRAETSGPRGIPQVIRAAQFLDQAPQISSFNRKRGSYGWKHVAERFHRIRDYDADCYVGEGAFLIAAWSMGVRVSTPGAVNVLLALSQQAVPSEDAVDQARRSRASAAAGGGAA